MATDDTLRDIRTRISNAQASRARAQVELDTAQERRQKAVESLQKEFGISTPADIASVQERLQTELDNATAEAVSALEVIEG